jgi:hypothetical protein
MFSLLIVCLRVIPNKQVSIFEISLDEQSGYLVIPFLEEEQLVINTINVSPKEVKIVRI